jgi:ABC-type nickel/cobalt efflux system permease component RcnA
VANQPPANPAMMQQASDPLAALRDIYQPALIELWPPAPGWWILAAVGMILLITACFWLWHRWSDNRYRREALQELEGYFEAWKREEDDHVFLFEIQQLLKRVALTRFDRQKVASLTGEAWLLFLDQSSNSHAFSIGPAEALIDGNYRLDINIDVTALENCARQWIKRHDAKHLIDKTYADEHNADATQTREALS